MATIADVAKLAGVAVGTASKAVNGRGVLRSETRKRVIDAAQQLGFRSNLLGEALTTGRTYTVGVISTDEFGRFTLPILAGAEDAFLAEQVSMFLCKSRGDPMRERHCIRTLLARKVDGIIVTGSSSDPRPSLGNLGVPVVYALGPSEDPSEVSVIPDDIEGAALAVRHLLDARCHRIVLIAGPVDSMASYHRIRGASSALRAAGLLPVANRAFYGEWSERSGRETILRILGDEDIDGVFCASDQIARGVIDALRESGRSVSDEIAVVGFDNWTVMTEASRPTLTTVDLRLRDIGRVAADRLLEAIQQRPGKPGVELVECQLLVRESTLRHALSTQGNTR